MCIPHRPPELAVHLPQVARLHLWRSDWLNASPLQGRRLGKRGKMDVRGGKVAKLTSNLKGFWLTVEGPGPEPVATSEPKGV